MSARASLRASEWVLSGGFLCILVSLWIIAKVQAWHYSKDSFLRPPPVQVVVEGFVERPNVYEIPLGTPIGEVLRKAKPKRFANLRDLDREARVRGPMHLQIEPLQNLRIRVEGAVQEPGTIEVAAGTRVCQLRQKISSLPNADLTFFKQRRLLNDGDLVQVPYQ